MKKLHLKLEELRVESFAAGRETGPRGTVAANQIAGERQDRLFGESGYAPRTEGTPDCPGGTVIVIQDTNASCFLCQSEPPLCWW